MGSADFSQFVVTTANETACEISTLKVHALFPHLPATFTGTSSNFWTSSLLADLSVFPSLICGSCTSGQGFAYSFLQIPPHDGHPCCSAIHFPLPGHVQDFHLRERAHGAQTKRAQDFSCAHHFIIACHSLSLNFMNKQTASKLRLEPGGLRRHQSACICHRKKLLNRCRIHCKRNLTIRMAALLKFC